MDFKIQTSLDGKEWKDVDNVQIVDNFVEAYPAYARTTFDAYQLPENTQYIKILFPNYQHQMYSLNNGMLQTVKHTDIQLAKVTVLLNQEQEKPVQEGNVNLTLDQQNEMIDSVVNEFKENKDNFAGKVDGFIHQGDTTRTGWLQDETGWRYVDERGSVTTGWKNIDGNWYYFDEDGLMQKWWIFYQEKWYYLNGSGEMETGWLLDQGKWYFLEESGSMKQNQWFMVGDKWYYVNHSGELLVNTVTTDGFKVNENGEWIPN